MPRPINLDDPERDPDYEEALRRYAESQLSASAMGGPAQISQIQVRPNRDADVEVVGSVPGPVAEAHAAAYRRMNGMPPPAQETVPAADAEAEATRYRNGLSDESFRNLMVANGRATPRDPWLDKPQSEKLADVRAAQTTPDQTPEGLAMYADLERAGKASIPPPVPGWRSALESLVQATTGPGLLQAWRNEPRTDRTPLQRMSDAVDDARNPLPDAAMPLPGGAPPASVPELEPKPAPRVRVGYAAPVKVANTALVESHGRGPDAEDPPGAPPKAVQVATSATRAAPATAEPSELDQALAAAAGRRLVAGLARAGGTMIGRGAGPGYDNLDAEADRPVQELQLRKAEADKASEADPSSPQSVAARAAVARMTPDLAKQPGWERQSAATLGRMFPWVKEIATLEAAKAEKEAARTAAAGQKDLDRENRLDVARIVHSGMGSTRQAALEDRRDKQRETYVEKASKDSEGASELADALERVEARIKKAGPSGDMPGVGRVTGRLAAAGMFSSDEDVQMRSDLQRMANIILHARSGAAVTPSEMDRAQIETGTQPGASTQQVRVAAEAAVRTLRRAQQNLRAKYPQETWDTIHQRGGWAPGDRPAGDEAPAAAGPPQISGVEEYNALPSGTAYIDPNGKPKVKR